MHFRIAAPTASCVAVEATVNDRLFFGLKPPLEPKSLCTTARHHNLCIYKHLRLTKEVLLQFSCWQKSPLGPIRLDLQHSGHRRRGKHRRRDAGRWRPPSWRPAQSANPPGAMPRPARWFVTCHGLWGLDEAVLALPAATITDSRSPLRASANIAGFVVPSGKQRVCVPIVAFSELSMPRRCGSRPPCDSMATGSSEAVMLPLTTLKHPQQRQATHDQATVPTSAGDPRPPQSEQLLRRRTLFLT